MSKPHLEKLLKSELGALNDVIDQKIIRGLSYTREARRHKFITARIISLKKQTRSWFGKMVLSPAYYY
jgi:hypothetical protein